MKCANLPEIRAKYEMIWKDIKKKYPKANGKLNFAFKGNFVPIRAGLVELLKENKYVFTDSPVIESLRNNVLLKLKNKEAIDIDECERLIGEIPLNSECRIEIIWEDLDYEIIHAMRVDPLIDLNLTPKGGGSIRIVLGKIG
jgi:hypothetical protein